jgi:hypothetical protein
MVIPNLVLAGESMPVESTMEQYVKAVLTSSVLQSVTSVSSQVYWSALSTVS